jgi:pSer/pThr/pTyr-binding forkhead associated (FHA) protein
MMAELHYKSAEGDVVAPLAENFTVGRLAENSLALPDDQLVSRRHASIERSGSGFVLRDLDSQNGTFVERGNVKKRVEGQSDLRSGDIIHVGHMQLTFHEPPGTAPQQDPSSTTIILGKTTVGRVLPVPRKEDTGSEEGKDAV